MTVAVTWKIDETTSAPLPPLARGLPFFGVALDMGRDPARFITNLYHKLGPVFRMRLMNREIFVLAGMDANNLVKQADETLFTNEIAFEWTHIEVGPQLTGADNERHAYLRRLLRPAYARSRATRQIPTLVKIVDDFIDTLQVGDSFEVFPTMQELVMTQLGCIMVDMPPGEYSPDLRLFMKTMIEVYQMGIRSKRAVRSQAYQRAKARSFEMARRVLEHHDSIPADQQDPDNAINILRRSVDPDGKPFGEASLMAEAISPYLAGQDTVAGSLSFICYTTHKYPDVHRRVSEEARAKFTPAMSANEMRQLDDLHKTIVETMRLYPIAPFMPRHALRTFEFAGCRIPAGAEVYTATAIPHFLPENYERPYEFDIDRPAGPSGTFVPYGVGNYACLGAGIADVQLLVTMAALLRRGRFELDPADYTMKLKVMPLLNPGPYRLKLVEKYH